MAQNRETFANDIRYIALGALCSIFLWLGFDTLDRHSAETAANAAAIGIANAKIVTLQIAHQEFYSFKLESTLRASEARDSMAKHAAGRCHQSCEQLRVGP
jgi:hypothetical protein